MPSTQRIKNSLMFALWSWATTNSNVHECNRFFGSFGHYVGIGLGWAGLFFLFSGSFSFLEPLYASCIRSGSSLFL